MPEHTNKQNSEQQKASAQSLESTESPFEYAQAQPDNRPDAESQRQLQMMANASPQVRQLMAFQRAVSSSGVIQMVAVGDAVSFPDGWHRITDETGDWNAKVAGGKVVELHPFAAAAASSSGGATSADAAAADDRPPVNDLNGAPQHVGCAFMVVADHMNMTATQLINYIWSLNDDNLKALVRQIFVRGTGATTDQLMQAMGIMGAVEEFTDFDAMHQDLTSDPDAPTWEGALSWQGHIVRIRGQGNHYEIWDPQSGERNTEGQVPRGQVLWLRTLV